ncbi:hypothetical protein BGX34_008941 [Mortierella sp. NVP85]|nr:hypothetical protein BGX34_008941 [Mortierella sp. NVP85]
MVFGHVVPNPRGNLSIQQSLDLANIYLDHAGKTLDPDIALVLCHDTEVSLFQAKRAAKQGDDHVVRHGIAAAYIGLGRVLELRGRCNEAQGIYKKAEKLGGKVQELAQPAQPLDTKNVAPSVKYTVNSSTNTPSVKDQPSSLREDNTTKTAALPAHIFAKNVRPSTIVTKLPEPDERLISTALLACCLGLLKDPHGLDGILEPVTRKWLQVVKKDEHERLKMLAADVIRTFKEREIMDAKTISEVVCLAPVVERAIFRDLLMSFYDVIDHSGLLNVHQLQGLAQVIQGADTGYLEANDVVKILVLLTARFHETHQQSPQHIYQLTLAVSCVLDAMADTKVEGLDLESLLKPLSPYLDALKGNYEPYLMYQAAYAYQALLCVLDNESLWQATTCSTGKLIQRESGLVSAVKGLDLNGFIGGLKVIQQATAFEVAQNVLTTFDGMKSITTISQGLLEGVKDGLDFKYKSAWYSALRGADTLIRDGDFAVFKRL